MSLAQKILYNINQYALNEALVYGNCRVNYKTLGIASKKIAQYFINQKIKNCRIQIKVANPIEHIYAIVGVILSQNHYISITDENASFINGLYDDEVYIITDDEPKIANEYNIQTLLNHALEKDLEWFSYDENAFLCSFVTSGSTGKPKLVQHTHKNISQDTFRQISSKNLNETDVFDFLFSFTFSASLACVITGLSCGGKIAIYPLKKLGLNQLPHFWATEKVSYSCLSVSTFRMLAHLNYPFKNLHSLKSVCISAEAHSQKDVDLFFEKFPSSTSIEIAYATTETRTITQQIITQSQKNHSFFLSVGKEVEGKKIIIVDDKNNVLPSDESGEIVVISDFIAATQYHDFAIQNDKNDMVTVKGYKTGDLGKISPEGYLFYLGRKNQEDKINGVKINLYMIEKELEKLHFIQKSYVFISKHQLQDKHFIAGCYVSDNPLNPTELKNKLAEQLPLTHLPAAFFHFKEFPKTHSGKIDTSKIKSKIISLLQSEHVELESNPENLSNKKEILRSIFSEVLKIKKDKINDESDFFMDLGGDSLLALISVSVIEKKLNLKLPSTILYKCRSINNLIKSINNPLNVSEVVTQTHLNSFINKRETIYFIKSNQGKTYQSFFESSLHNTHNLIELEFDIFNADFDFKTTIIHLQQKINQNNSTIVGHSLNGFFAYVISCNNPKIKNVILLDTFDYWRYEDYTKMSYKLFLNIGKKIFINRDFLLPYFVLKEKFKLRKKTYNLDYSVLLSDNYSFLKTIQSFINTSKKISSANCFFIVANRSSFFNWNHGNNWKPLFHGYFKKTTLKTNHLGILKKQHIKKIVDFCFS